MTLPCAAKMAAFPVSLHADALTGTAAFQAAAFQPLARASQLAIGNTGNWQHLHIGNIHIPLTAVAQERDPPRAARMAAFPVSFRAQAPDWDSRLLGGGICGRNKLRPSPSH